MAISVTLLPYALTDVDMVKDHLGIPDANTDYDERIKRHINAATDTIERWTDRMLLERTALEDIQSGRRNDRILLPQWPVNTVSELWVDPSSEFTDTQYLLDPSKYRIEKDSRGNGVGIVLLNGCLFPRGQQNIRILYNGGYQSLPWDLQEAAIFLTEYYYDLRQDHRIAVTQKGKNQENVTFLEQFPTWMQDTVQRYRREEFALGNIAVQNG